MRATSIVVVPAPPQSESSFSSPCDGGAGLSWEVLGSWARSLIMLLGLLGRLGQLLGALGNLGLFTAKPAKQIWELATTRVFSSEPRCRSRRATVVFVDQDSTKETCHHRRDAQGVQHSGSPEYKLDCPRKLLLSCLTAVHIIPSRAIIKTSRPRETPASICTSATTRRLSGPQAACQQPATHTYAAPNMLTESSSRVCRVLEDHFLHE